MTEIATSAGLGLLLLGTVMGIIVGSIPGLTGAMLIALSLPFTFQLSGAQALILLVSMYVGAVSGGLISATILRIPGTPASMVTTLDGYPMMQAGEGAKALSLGVTASFFGGMVSFVFLALLAQPVASLSVLLGPFEFFGLVLVALVILASVGGSNLLAGLLSGVFGMLVAIPGMSPATGQLRWTFGFEEMADGFKLLPVLIGLFAVNGVIQGLRTRSGEPSKITLSSRPLLIGLRSWKKHWPNGLRSSLIGTWVGVLPGIGANIGSILAYGVARRFSRHPERFGKGAEEGVVASESANNATVGGALIPLISLGIPGSVIDAILLGALMIHGLQPGPFLFTNHPEIVHTVIATFFFSNIVMFVVMLISASWIARLGRLPQWLLLPIILTFCVVGTYSLGNRMFDVWVMVGFGGLGFMMDRYAIPLAPFVIGFVLAPLAEENLSAGLMASGGSILPLFTRPLSMTFVVLSGLLLFWPLFRRKQTES